MKDIGIILDAAIDLENTMSGLYAYFSNRFPGDFDFWEQLRIEELNHAALLRTTKDLLRVNLFPEGLIMDDLEDYERTIAFINHSMNEKSIPNRKSAFELAHTIEKSSGELHFQETATKKDPDEITRIFMHLNGMDLDHAKRILEYQESNNLAS
jgi:hypothetical protein